jgi:hypothetical protein
MIETLLARGYSRVVDLSRDEAASRWAALAAAPAAGARLWACSAGSAAGS